MRLPDIEYTASLPSPVTSAGAPYDAAGQLTKVMQDGLAAVGQEILKTQQLSAAATLQERLNEATLDIQAKPTITAQELRDVLGDDVPPHLRPFLTVQRIDPESGKTIEEDNPAIPMFVAGGDVFKARAKAATLEASSSITMPGWQADFQDRARAHVEQTAMHLAEQQLQAMHRFQSIEQKTSVERLVNAGSFREANFAIAQSQVLSPAEKVEEWRKVKVAEQLKPVLDAEASNDIPTIEAQIRRLRAPAGEDTDALSREHREAYAHRLEAQVKSIRAAAEAAEEKRLKRNADTAYGRLASLEAAARVAGRTPTVQEAFALVPKLGIVKGEDMKGLVAYAEAMTKGTERKTDLALYQGLSVFAAENPDAFRDDKIQIPTPTGVKTVGLYSLVEGLSDSDFRHFANIQGALRKEGKGAAYADFIGAEELVNARLASDYKYDLKTTDETERAEIGRLKLLVNSALSRETANKGSKLSTTERDKIIEDTLRREVRVKKTFWNYLRFTAAQTRELATAGVNADLATTLYGVTARAGQRMTPQEVVDTAKDFGFYEAAITDAWAAQSSKPLSMEAAVEVYSLLKSRWGQIDAELARQGQLPGGPESKLQAVQTATNAKRASLAVQGYLKGVR